MREKVSMQAIMVDVKFVVGRCPRFDLRERVT